MQKISFKLEVFEGPMDLLLNLITKHKLNIYDIEISSLLEQYREGRSILAQDKGPQSQAPAARPQSPAVRGFPRF